MQCSRLWVLLAYKDPAVMYSGKSAAGLLGEAKQARRGVDMLYAVSELAL